MFYAAVQRNPLLLFTLILKYQNGTLSGSRQRISEGLETSELDNKTDLGSLEDSFVTRCTCDAFGCEVKLQLNSI